ncbi:MAG TPA: cysteine rich repeat-containing protein [Burkholderiales bacterium]|nr:cysteine rich repeat-containing protein [Burkholderiales bacterium]
MLRSCTRQGFAIALAALIAAPLAAFAQAASCKADLAKFCPQAKPGGGQIAACLKTNAAQLSPSCKARVGQMQELLKEVHQACEEDIHFLCDGIQPGGGRIAACLKQSESEVSPGCKARIAAAKVAK